MKIIRGSSLATPILLIWWALIISVFGKPDKIIHKKGVCVMRGECGGNFFTKFPCVDNTPAIVPETTPFRQLLIDTCGAEYMTGPACCNEDQLNNLVVQVKKAEAIIASCPACWKNFLQFWCSFTCSPDQSTFVNITATEINDDNTTSVKEADFWVGDNFGQQFFDSCKDIKFGASNGYAMDFIGGGAIEWHGMLSYMGQKRPGLGSPFQIDFPPLNQAPSDGLERYNQDGRPCNDTDPAYRCACVDCQAVCPILPPAPSEQPDCHIGLLRCWSFAMLITYTTILALGTTLLLARNKRIGKWIQQFLGVHLDRAESRGLYEPLALSDDPDNALGGDDEEEDLLDPDYTPRRYWLNSRLQNWFYYQGLFCARYPWFVIMTSLGFVAICSLGWSRFALERNPINLWVSPSSTALAQKNHFDQSFTPFYRTSQLFFVSETDEPIASADRLESLFKLEDEIRSFKSDVYNNTLQDVCFHPNGPACIVQSVTGYWEGDMDNFERAVWRETLKQCTSEPSQCLPEFKQPLKPEMILGGYKDKDYLSARAFVVTFVLTNSVNETLNDKPEHWEKSLLSNILTGLNDRPEWKGVRISYSTEVSCNIRPFYLMADLCVFFVEFFGKRVEQIK